MNAEVKALFDFLAASPSPFHAVRAGKDLLAKAGFEELRESEPWTLLPGHAYYTDRNGSALIAFRIPKEKPAGIMLAAAHSDSPTFKIKENAELANDTYLRLNAEPYGGMICSSWFDRPLSLAGRAVVRTETGIATSLVCFDRDLLLIPNVAIHMNRAVNSGYTYNMAVDMVPLLGSGKSKGAYRRLLAEELGVGEDDILSADLFLYNRMKGTQWGAEDEFISAPRLDDLQCAYAALSALIAAKEPTAVAAAAILDNEEVGSGTKQGADSDFLQTVLSRICTSLGTDPAVMLANGFMVSADNAHAVHPNHPEYADATHRPVMNGGIVIKFNANQKYTTDAVSCALFELICKKASVPYQYFANRSDLAGGSTLGNISNTHVSLNTVDIGLPQLAMHSSYETAGALDTGYLMKALTAAFLSSVRAEGSGCYTLL